MSNLVLVRHGESRWNLCNRFTGWIDVPLSENGIREAQACAQHCKAFDFSAAFTSKLARAHLTLFIILASQNRTGVIQHEHDAKYYRWIKRSNNCGEGDLPVYESSALNERYYGALQGLDKNAAEKKYGKEKVFAWRRDYRARPPGGETLHETFERVWPYVRRHVLPRLKRGEDILFVGHGNTMRSIIRHLDKLPEDEAPFLDLPHGIPIVYRFTRGTWKHVSGEYDFGRPLR